MPDFVLLAELYESAPDARANEKERSDIPPKIRKQVLARDKVCVVCGHEAKICHHINLRGESVPDNLVMLCRHCHEWLHWLLSKDKGWKFYLPFRRAQ